MKFKCSKPGCNATVEYEDEDALADDGKWEYWSIGEFYCPKHWRQGTPKEEKIVLDNYEKSKDYPIQGMPKLIIIRPPSIREDCPHWEPELEFPGSHGYTAGCAFATIVECIDWVIDELSKKYNFNKFGRPFTEIEVIIYKAIENKRIKLKEKTR